MKITVDYKKIFNECKDELRSIGIPIADDDHIIDIVPDIRSSARYCGQCAIGHNRTFLIRITSSFVIGKHPDINNLKNVMIHELIHTCPGCFCDSSKEHHHSDLFFKYCAEVLEKTGHNALEIESVASYRRADLPVIFVHECPKCRRSKIFRTMEDIERDPVSYQVMTNGKKYIFYCLYCHTPLTYWYPDECDRIEYRKKHSVYDVTKAAV